MEKNIANAVATRSPELGRDRVPHIWDGGKADTVRRRKAVARPIGDTEMPIGALIETSPRRSVASAQ